ncbi:MAG: hypothetical protein OES38_19720, partial [Gammaproteobacteria bacterium]|nr:hypothetical protein [Gammaproteobacteria bacterium]
MLTRRRILAAGAGVFAAAGFASRAAAEDAASLQKNLVESELIYLTPIRTDGSDSRCQAEVWFVHHEADLYVVTATEAWRAQAIDRGLARTRIWVGDVGQWGDSDGRYLELPRIEAMASRVEDTESQNAVLDAMGSKYRIEWFVWGPRFR